jgi:hypothetical protein
MIDKYMLFYALTKFEREETKKSGKKPKTAKEVQKFIIFFHSM